MSLSLSESEVLAIVEQLSLLSRGSLPIQSPKIPDGPWSLNGRNAGNSKRMTQSNLTLNSVYRDYGRETLQILITKGLRNFSYA